MKNVTVTCAPVTGLPSEPVSCTRTVFAPFRGGLVRSEVNLHLCSCLLVGGLPLVAARCKAAHCALQLRFGINEEIGGADNTIAGFESVEHDDGIVELGPVSMLRGSNEPSSVIDERNLARYRTAEHRKKE